MTELAPSDRQPANDIRLSSDFIIETRALTKRYGGVTATDNMDLSIPRGEVYGIIGPNGAGKSTLVGLLGGAVKASSGTIIYDGEDITALPAPERARRGIGRTHQIPRPFLDMTVAENLKVALFSIAPLISTGKARGEVDAILARTGLSDAVNIVARNLPLLRRKRLEVARALMLRPKLLLLDEVGAGLIDSEVTELIELIRSVADGKTSIVIVEHVIRIVRECCHQLAVLHIGAKFAEGPTASALADKEVAAIYLGTAHSRVHTITSVGSATRESALGQSAGKGEPLLQVRNVAAGYGQARVLNNINLDIAPGEAVAILGPNGAGKTTLANTIAGAIKATSGHIVFDGTDVTSLPSHGRQRLGIAHCMEGRRIFPTLSVEENLLIAAREIAPIDRKSRLEEIYALFPALHLRRCNAGTSLSGGEQQMLAIGRSLMSRPRLVIFDEISLGLAPIAMDRLYDTLRQLRRDGFTMLIIEQDIDRALDLADRACVMERGRLALSGSPAEIMADQHLKQLYLGEGD
ncbi:MAG: ATP-binding cassette domain-containing protein [Xanthobacteraceae bacterium]